MTDQLYLDDPLRLEFSAQVEETFALPDGKTAAILPATFFYPTGGGQEHDTGSIGEAAVLDVYRDDRDRIVHVLDRELAPGAYPARIDRDRRLRAMQHHTGQHLLSAAFLHVLDLESVSANINGSTPSTVDLDAPDVPAEDVRRVEDAVNALIFEDRPVRSYFVTDAEVASIPFRKPPKVSGRIRVVEVDGYDYTPCGGTHCTSTGMIGLLRVVRAERLNHKLRLHFVAGLQALDVFRAVHESARQAADLLSARPEDLAPLVRKLLDEAAYTRAELETWKAAALDAEARQLAQEAESVGQIRLATRLYAARPAAELRALAGKLRSNEGLAAVLASQDGQKLSLVVSAAPGCGLEARGLLEHLLAPLGGRGGGDSVLAQGGGTIAGAALPDLFDEAKHWILSMI